MKRKQGAEAFAAKAKAAGLSESQLAEAKKAGIDIDNPEALKAYRGSINTRADDRTQPPRNPSTETAEMTIEELEKSLLIKGITANEARTIKIQIEGMRGILAYKKDMNQLISREEAAESDAKLAHAVNAMLRKFEREIPALCFGQHDMGKLKETVKDLTREIQAAVAAHQDEFWKNHEER